MNFKRVLPLMLWLAACITGCNPGFISIRSNTPGAFYNTPSIVTSIASLGVTPRTTSTQTATPGPSPTPTLSPTPTFTFTPTARFGMNAIIQTCDTGMDVFNQMGEVTNAYVTIQNLGNRDLTNLTITLNASDEDRAHPDKSYAVQMLPVGYEISLKLTVDTQSSVDTSIDILATAGQGITATAAKDSCRSRHPEQDIINALGELFVARKMSASTDP